jgi:valyl-tRNA synthetase
MDKVYAPQDIERRICERWESRFAPGSLGAPYCMIPPPNLTGTLPMGHAFQPTLTDERHASEDLVRNAPSQLISTERERTAQLERSAAGLTARLERVRGMRSS